MNRRPVSSAKSPLNAPSVTRRTPTLGVVAPRFRIPAFALFASLSLLAGRSAFAANTEYDVINGQTDLTAQATYNTGGPSTTGGTTPATTPPSATSDVTFDSSVTYSPSTFFDSSNTGLVLGSINVLTATPITIENNVAANTAASITLSGGDTVTGSTTADQLQVASGASLTFGGGLGPLTIFAGSGTNPNWLVNGSLTTTATTTINIVNSKGLVFVGTGNATINGNITSGATGTFSDSMTGGSLALNGVDSAALGLTFAGTGGAQLLLGNQNALQTSVLTYTSGAVVFSSTVTGNAFTLGGLAGATNLALVNNATTPAAIALTLGNSIPTAASYSGILSGAGSLIKAGTNIQTLTGANTFSGTTTINNGVLDFGNVTSTSASSAITVNAGGTAGIAVGTATGLFTNGTTGNGTIGGFLSGLGGQSGSTVTFNSGSFVGIDTTSASTTYAGVIANPGSGAVLGLNKLGTNTLTLTGANTYTGLTAITAGTLQIGGTSTLNGGTYAASIADAGTFEYSSSAAQTLSGSIGGAGVLTKDTNTSTLTLSGANTFTAATTVSAGTLDLANQFALQNSALSVSGTGAVTFDSSVASNAFSVGALGSNQNIALQNTANVGITLTVGSYVTNANSTYSGNFLNTTGTGTSGVTFQGAFNTVNLTGTSTYTGATTIFGSTVNLGNAGANGSISSSSPLVMDGGTLTYTRTGSTTQSFASTSIGAGASFINAVAGDTLNLGAISRSAGTEVDFTSATNTGAVNTTTTANVNGILGGWATFGGKATWAVAPTVAGGAITGLPNGSYTETGTAGTTASNYLNQNIDVNATVTQTAPINPNSIRFNSSTAPYTLTLTGLNTLTSGGILVSSNVGMASSPNTISGGSLTAGAGGDLAISSGDSYTNGTGGSTALTISSTIVDNGSPLAVSYAGYNGRVALSLNNTSNSFSGGLFINGGEVTIPAASTTGTSLGVGTLTISPNSSSSNAGALLFNGAGTTATGLLVDTIGIQGSNGTIDNGAANSNATLALFGAPTATATFNGVINSYAAGRCVNLAINSGTEIVGNTNTGSNMVIANGGTIQVGNGIAGSFSNSSNLVQLVVGGGTFLEFGNFAGTTTQSFQNGLSVLAGGSTVSVNNNNAAGTVVAITGTSTRAVGGTVNFVLPSGSQTASNGITTSTTNTNGILGGYATVGGTDWATNATNTAGGNVIGLSSSTINAYSTDTFGAGLNTDVTGSDAFPAGSTNSIRFNTAGANTLTLGGTGIVTSGGILVTSNVGANLTDITGNTLEGAAGADLVVIQNNTGGSLEIDSTIANNGAATGLTKSGAGTLILTGTNTYTGGIFLNGGILNTATAGIDGSSATNGITFNGGTLQAATGGITTGKAVVIGATGGTIDTNGNAVTLSGNITNVGGQIGGAGNLGGFNSTGAFAFTKTGAGTLTLSGIGNAFGGPLVINNGTVLDSAASGAATFGTGYVNFVNNANTPTMDLGGHSATVAGLIGAGTNGLVTNSGTASSVLTLNGVSTQTFAGTIKDGATNTVGLTVALNNPTEAQILTGASTYSGPTTVNVGGLLVNGSLTPATAGTAAVTVGSTAAGGGTLGGTGTLTVSSVMVNTGGTLAPGATRGATTGALTLNTTSGLTITGGTLAIGIAGSGGTSLATNGTLTLGSGSILAVTGTANGTSDYDLANYGSLSGTFATANIPAGYTINYDGSTFSANDIELDVTAVPEPSTLWSSVLMLAASVWQYRRRSRRAVS